MSRVVHDLAWYWKVPPREVWECPADRFLEWIEHTERIDDEIEAAPDAADRR